MFVKPSSAFVEKPSLVASSSGSAKKARYARLLPSTRNSSDSRAGPSSSWSSCPVRVFGTRPSYRLAAMARLEIRPFSAEFTASAGELLAERHRAHRAAEPLLPERYEDAVAAAAEVEALASSPGASGAVALRGGRVVGYLVGVHKDDGRWGPNVWVDPAGHAV